MMNTTRLKKTLKERGLMQKEVADYLNVTNPTVSQWLSGKRDPNDEMKKKLASFLGISLDYLMGDDNEKAPDTNVGSLSNSGNIVVGNGNSVNQTIGDPFALRHNQQEHLRSITPPGRCTDAGSNGAGSGAQTTKSSGQFLTREDVTMIPVISAAGTFPVDGQCFSLPLNEIPKLGPNVDTSTLFAMQISDDMMTPYLSAGDYAVCELTQGVMPGQLAVVTLYGSCLIRGIRKGIDQDIVSLVVGNKTYPNTDIDAHNRSQLTVIGRVLRIFHASTAPGILM